MHLLSRVFFVLVFLVQGITMSLAQKPYYDEDCKAWESSILPSSESLSHVICLIGDAGAPDFTKPSAIKLLHSQVKNSGNKSSVAFLGDNIYSSGLPEESDKNREDAEERLKKQIGPLTSFTGKVIFVPGNHDWDHWGKEGLAGIKREEAFVEAFLGKGNTFLPDNGCPGPAEIVLSDDLVLLAIDTQWWLHKWNKNTESNKDCTAKDDETFIENLNNAILRNSDKQILVVAHHPIISNGNHGGYFPFKEHLFPFTAFWPNCYFPLPVLGSFHPFYRKYINHIQDLGHKRYKLLSKALKGAFKRHENLIFAAGHDHNLQYFHEGQQHYIVSGSGSKTTYVAKGHNAKFTYSKQGFVKLYYYENGEVWMEMLVVSEIVGEGKVVYRRKLVE